MPALLVCPDLQRYQDLASGRLPVLDKDALLNHLESCDPCAQRLGTLMERSTMVELVRSAKSACEGTPREEVNRLVERLSKLNPLDASSVQLTFRCSECGKNLKVPPGAAGKKVKCPHCQKAMIAPGSELLTRTAGSFQAREQERNDGVTPAPSMPLSTTEPGSLMEKGPANNGDTIAQEGHQPSELTECLAPAQAPDELGRLGSYRVLAILGAGGMGVVYKAEDPQLKRLVALKAMLPGLGASASARQRFLREARSAAAVKHDHIVSIYQVGEERSVPYLAMEFLVGEPLDERLKRDKHVPLGEILRIGREMAEGLSAAHEAGLIHRDIKPGNIWLEGKKARVKILDFGLARAADESQHLTQSGAIVGTPAYMAPEQAQGRPVDHRCDLFSLGVVLYRLCTAQMPFQGTDTVSMLIAVSTHEPPPPATLNPQLPPALSELVMHLLAKEPAQRVKTAEEVVQSLAELQKQVETGAIAELKPVPLAARMIAPAGLDKTNPDTVTKEFPAPARGVPPRSTPRLLIVAGLGAAAVLLVLLGGGLLVYEFMFRTGNGTLVVQVDGEDADLRFKNGKLLIFDTNNKLLYTLAPSEKNKSLPFGKYLIKVEGADGVELDTGEFVMTQKVTKVRVRVLPNAIVQKGPDGKDEPPVVPAAAPGAEQGVLDYAEIHDADEKRFDAWLAQMQKDGYCPASLSVQTVQGAPRFTAVALKEEKKKIWEIPRVLITDDKHIDIMRAKNYLPFADCVYRTDGKLMEAILWIWEPNGTLGGIWSGPRAFVAGKIDEGRAGKSRPIYLSAFAGDDGTTFTAIIAEQGPHPWAETVNQPIGACRAHLEKQKAQGWRPAHLYAYGAGAKTLFGAILVQDPDGPAWDASWSLTPAEYEAELSARKKQGFRPHTAVAHDDDAGKLRFSVIWLRYRSANVSAPTGPTSPQTAEHGVHDYAEIHDADEKRFDAWVAQMKKDGFRPVRMNVQTVKDAPRYTAVALKDDKKWPWEFSRVGQGVEGHAASFWKKKFEAVAAALYRDKGKTREAYLWAKDDSLDNNGLWFGDAPFVESKIKNARKEKLRLISRTAVFEGNEIQYCILFEAPDGVPWQESHNLSLEDLKDYVEKHKADGWRPDHFCYYGVGTKRLFGAILIKDATRADWDVSWSLTPADYAKELSARKVQGFRPLSAIGHEDHGGAQRFSAIWIRYRLADSPARPEEKKAKRPAAAFKHKIGMEFVKVPAGKAWLGGGGGKEGTKPVAFEHDFFLGMYEVTQEEWETVMGLKHPFHFSRKGEGKDALASITDAELKRFPVENVSWNECQLFLKKLNELDKKPGWEYRLPTEAEWEYACRGGPGDKFQSAFDYYLEDPTNVLLTAQANFEHAAGLKRTRPVGSYPPNKLGLFDMHGNVSELTHDAQPEKDDEGNPRRNERGGGWTNTADECVAIGHFAWSPTARFQDVGLRVALVPVKK